MKLDDSRGSELACTYSHMWCDRLAMKDERNSKTTITHNEMGPQIGLQATHQIV